MFSPLFKRKKTLWFLLKYKIAIENQLKKKFKKISQHEEHMYMYHLQSNRVTYLLKIPLSIY